MLQKNKKRVIEDESLSEECIQVLNDYFFSSCHPKCFWSMQYNLAVKIKYCTFLLNKNFHDNKTSQHLIDEFHINV